jgi:predicted nucleotidyltransferase
LISRPVIVGRSERRRMTSYGIARWRVLPVTAAQTGDFDSGDRRARLKASDASAVADFAARVRSALGSGVLDMRLFGSKATGRDVPDSDIDILVVVGEASVGVEDQVLAIALDVNLAHDVYISPCVVARTVLEDPVWRITPFLQAASAGTPV